MRIICQKVLCVTAIVAFGAAFCALSCSSSESCAGGICSCQSFYEDPVFLCDGVCVHVGLDPNNCGACGQVCAANLFCSNGQCSPGCLPLDQGDVPTCQQQSPQGPITCPPTYAACSVPFATCQCEAGIPQSCGCR